MAEDFPKFFDLEGVPLRRLRADWGYEIYRGSGRWEGYYDTERADTFATRVTERELADNCAAYDKLVSDKDG